MSYELTKLSNQSQMYIGFISSNLQSRSKAVSLAIARVLASKLTLPSEATDITAFYNTQHRITVEGLINRLNSLVVLDVNTVLDYTKKFYQFRYEALYPSQHVLAINKESAVCDFFKISKMFDCAVLDVIKNEGTIITEANMRFTQILNELLLENKDGAQ